MWTVLVSCDLLAMARGCARGGHHSTARHSLHRYGQHPLISATLLIVSLHSAGHQLHTS
jgi:hypothetical protein